MPQPIRQQTCAQAEYFAKHSVQAFDPEEFRYNFLVPSCVVQYRIFVFGTLIEVPNKVLESRCTLAQFLVILITDCVRELRPTNKILFMQIR